MADMGSENQDAAVEWSENHRSSQRKQSQPAPASPSSKLLTLPTVLTLGRVAAVPLLIGSMSDFKFCFFLSFFLGYSGCLFYAKTTEKWEGIFIFYLFCLA